jgi:hypothetical protein
MNSKELETKLLERINYCKSREEEIKREHKDGGWCDNRERIQLSAERAAYYEVLEMINDKTSNSAG